MLWETRPGALDSPAVAKAVADLRPLTTARVPVARVPLSEFNNGPAATRSLERLRATPALAALPGVDHAVAGKTAFARDFTDAVSAKAPLVVGFVLVLAVVLLTAAFRSPPVALASIALNLLSLGAA
ncbi:MMPL family transporter [Actinomadura atramentaria]|uniref:MMPL family transporter n=1 Tax=Actinomadura atramentaria TaxID=1990 RepID=UPI0003749282|nr:MMPL family transporter [Actinomadura atramentaria]